MDLTMEQLQQLSEYLTLDNIFLQVLIGLFQITIKLFADNPIFLLPFILICVIMVRVDKKKSKAVDEEDK